MTVPDIPNTSFDAGLPAQLQETVRSGDYAERSRISKWFDGVMVTAQTAPFIGGAIRYGGFALVLATTKDTLLSSGYLAGSTAITEFGATVSMSRILDDQDSKVVPMIDKTVGRLLPEGRKVSTLASVVITNYVGSPGLMYAKNREDPTRTRLQNRRTGYKSTVALTGATFGQGALIAEGVTDPTNPKIMIPAIAGIAVMGAFGKWTKDKLTRNVKAGRQREDQYE